MSSLHWADYVVCLFSFLLSIAIGVFYGYKDRNRRVDSAEEFLVGGRHLQVLPVSMSILVSWLSAISFIGDPVEVYYHGAVYVFLGVGYCLPLPLVAHYFAPAFNRTRLISVCEYLETRYNVSIRTLVSAVKSLTSCTYLAIVIYAPAVALSQVTGLPDWLSIIITGCVGTFYTTLGGIKAVVWTDVLQTCIMFIGVVTVIIRGLVSVGGISEVIDIAERGNRLNFLQNSWSPLVRSSVWTYLVGGFFRVYLPYVSSQAILQRYLSLPSERDTTLTVYLNIPLYILFVATFTVMGLIMYAYYYGCDPLLMGRITKPDQLVPLFMFDMLGFAPGLPGLFLASLFAASLSSISSGLNSTATNIVKDFVDRFYLYRHKKSISDRTTTQLAKIITALLGVFVTSLAFATLFAKTNVFPLTAKITGLTSGPVGAMFVCGMCVPFVDTVSAIAGAVCGLGVCLWLGIGSFFYPPTSEVLSTSMDVCLSNISDSLPTGATSLYTQHTVSNIETLYTEHSIHEAPVTSVYSLSFLLYAPLGFILTSAVAILLAFVRKTCNRVMSVFKTTNKQKSVDLECALYMPVKQ